MSVLLTTFLFEYLVDTKQFSSAIRLTSIKSGTCLLQVRGLLLFSYLPLFLSMQDEIVLVSPFLFSGGGNATLPEVMPYSFCCFCKVSNSFLFLTHRGPDNMYAPLITSVFLLCFLFGFGRVWDCSTSWLYFSLSSG